MSGAIQKIDKSILDTARSDLSYAENMIIILCILTGEVGMPSEKYIDFFYYSISGQNIRLNRAGNGSKESFNKAMQELLDSGHCIETRGGIQFYQKVFTADDDDKRLIEDAYTFKSFLKAAADKCEKSEDKCAPADDKREPSDDKCATAEDFDRNEPDDMGTMQYVKHSFALDLKTRGCDGIVVYNVADKTYRVLKGSRIADTITNSVANGMCCENLQKDRESNSDKISNLEVISDIYLPSMSRCLDFIGGDQSCLKLTKVHNSSKLELWRIIESESLYDKYIASGKSVEGLDIPEEQQFAQAQEVKQVAPVKPAVAVVSLQGYSYSVGDTLIVKGDDYCGKVEYTGSGWKILAGSICGKRGANLSEEDADFLKNLGLTKQVDFTTRAFNSDVTVSTFKQAHALLAHQYNETIDTFVYDYTETLQPIASVLTDSTSIRAMLSDGKSKRYSKLFEIRVDE